MQPDDKWANFKAEREEERPKAGPLLFVFLLVLSFGLGAVIGFPIFVAMAARIGKDELMNSPTALSIFCAMCGLAAAGVFLSLWFTKPKDDDFNNLN